MLKLSNLNKFIKLNNIIKSNIYKSFSTNINTTSAPSTSNTNNNSHIIDTTQSYYTLPSTCYHEQDHFNIEQKDILEKSWLLIGHTNALLPKIGSVAEIKVVNESIMIVRNSLTDIAAYYNVCPHRAHEMVPPGTKTQLKSKTLTCKNHGWSFHASTGSLVKARFCEDVNDFCEKDFNLKKVPIQSVLGLLFVNLNNDIDTNNITNTNNNTNITDVFGQDLTSILQDKIPGIDSPDMTRLAVTEKVFI
jgi:nitrite reductase/ring-hydroxylating ferredoxin subunit